MKNELKKPKTFCGNCRKEIDTREEYHYKFRKTNLNLGTIPQIPDPRMCHRQAADNRG